MKRLVLLLPIVAGIMFGSCGVFVRVLYGYGFDSATVLFLRTAFAALILLVGILFYDKSLLKIKLKDAFLFIGSGVVGMMGLNLCYNVAITVASLSLSAVLLSTAPVFVVFLAAVIFKERVTKRKLACMLFAIVGCVLASGLLEQKSGVEVSAMGILAGVGSAVFYALYSIFSRMATDRGYHTYTIIFYSVLFITIVLLPFSNLSLVGGFIVETPVFSIVFLLAHALCTSVIPYVAITLSLLYAEAGKVSILASGAEPVAALVFGILFYAEIPSPLMLLGVAVTIAALAFLCKVPKQEDN